MSQLMSPAEIADRSERAVAAAAAAGRDLGLDVTDPTLLYDSFSVVVHLRPTTVVARMPTVLPTAMQGLDSRVARQRIELDVSGWLAAQGLPVVKPSPLVPAEPVARDGFSMTLWEFVEHDKSAELDYVANAAAGVRLHRCLRDYPGRLPFLSPLAMIPSCLAELGSRPDLIEATDLDRARREWELLAPALTTQEGFAREFGAVEVQPIHGDVPAFNMIPTPGGLLYSDFEDPTLGPVEWDLAMVGPEAEAAYDAESEAQGRRRLDGRVLRVLGCARMLQVVACLALVPQLPSLREGLDGALAAWRDMPFAGGLARD